METALQAGEPSPLRLNSRIHWIGEGPEPARSLNLVNIHLTPGAHYAERTDIAISQDCCSGLRVFRISEDGRYRLIRLRV